MAKITARLLLFGTTIAAASAIAAADQTIIPENWKSCAVGDLKSDTDEGWGAIPKWAAAPHLKKYYQNNPRLLMTHGLCNEKFKRLVVCGPGWDEDGDPSDPAHRVCQEVGKHMGKGK